MYKFGTFDYSLKLDYFYLRLFFSFSPPIILSATFSLSMDCQRQTCSFALKMLEDVVKGKKRAIALYQGFMDNTVVFDTHILLAGGKRASINKPSGMSITLFSIYFSLDYLSVVDLYQWVTVPEKMRECSWLCKNLSRLLDVLSWGRMQEYCSSFHTEYSIGFDWDYLSGEPDLLSLHRACRTSRVEPSGGASKGLFFASMRPADFMHLCSCHIKHDLAPTMLPSTLDS